MIDDIENKNFKQIEMKLRNSNVATFYQISSIFNFSELVKFSLRYIERCFPMVCKNINLNNLSLVLIAKIISSSELNIDSEKELINAIDSWISYDFEKRSKFASRLLSKVRLNLLSNGALNSMLDSDVCFNRIDDCVAILNDVLNNKISFQNITSRYCSQNMYSIILCGGYENKPNGRKFSDVTKLINAKNVNNVTDINSMKIKIYHLSLVYCRGAVYVIGGYDENDQFIKSVKRYSLVTSKWEIVGEIFNGQVGFCACRFMEHIFIIGGCNKSITSPFYSCKKFDTNNNKWYEVAKINKARIGSASTVYEEKIVVFGGINDNDIYNYVNTVEAYDPFANSWSSMPNMIEGRFRHGSVAIKNKLFVIGSLDGKGSNSCEVFDSNCNKFVLLKRLQSTLTFDLS